MPFPIDVSRCLAFAPTDTPLRLITIPFDSVRAKLVARGLHEGDEITREGMDGGHVLVTMADGRRLVIERQNAVMIEVEPLATAALPSTVWDSQYAIAR